MKYFTIQELCKSTTADKYHINNTPTQEVIKNLTELVNHVLDPLRESMGRSIAVSSGYRCKALNTKVGGAKTSQHLYGQAADIYCTKKVNGKTVLDTEATRKLYDMVLELGLDFDQMILEKGTMTAPQWVHISFKWNGRNRKDRLYFNGKSYIRI